MSENSYLITLLQKENQTIIAYEVDDKGNYTGVSHTKSFFAKANSKWKFTVVPDKFHEDYWIHIIQSDHQTITVRDNASFHDYRAGILVSYPDDDKLTGIQAGNLDSGIYPETNYDVAVEEPHDRYKYLVVNQNCRIFATLARDLYNTTDYHTVSIKQTSHQTIIFTYRNKKYYGDTVVENNEDYTVEVVPNRGYASISLIINGKTINSLKYTGKATEDLNITAVELQTSTDFTYLEFTFKEFNSNIEKFNNSDGKLLVGTLQDVADTDTDKTTYKLSINQSAHQTITVTANGNKYTDTVSLPYGTTYTVSITADAGYIAGELNKTSGTITGDETINATPAIQIKPQVFVAKGEAPWYNTADGDNSWSDKDKVISTDKSISGQAIVTCKDVTNMGHMFDYYNNLTSLDLSNFDTSKVTDMGGMFYGCSNLTSLDITKFNTSNVTDMSLMFIMCASLTSLNVSNFNTSSVTDMRFMFNLCTNLTSLDVSNFDTSNVKDMSHMFSDCRSITSLDVSNFDTSKVTDMHNMFQTCYNLTSLDVSKFNTSNVTNMSYMFTYCTNLTTLDLSSFDTSNVTDMTYMFWNCTNLTTIKGVIDMKSCTKYTDMFKNCTKLKGVKIKNPPSDFNDAGLSSSQYTIVS